MSFFVAVAVEVVVADVVAAAAAAIFVPVFVGGNLIQNKDARFFVFERLTGHHIGLMQFDLFAFRHYFLVLFDC